MEERISVLDLGGGRLGYPLQIFFWASCGWKPGNIDLTPEEHAAFNALTSDNGKTYAWDLLKQTVLVEFGLSPVSKKVITI